MNRTAGQARALEQLRDVEDAASGLFTVDGVMEPDKPGDYLSVRVTLFLADLERAEGGLPLQDREEVLVLVPHNFPFDDPSALVLHDRFAGFPHVQWKHSLCLYQAPATEWNPSDGMFGFLDRLHYWFKQGALGQLDPVGGPLHPPVAYTGGGPTRTVIPRTDTPPVGDNPWFGTAHLRTHSDNRVDVVGWSSYLEPATPPGVAAAVLMPTPFPYEFPDRVADLIAALDERGVSRERLFLTLQWAVVHNADDAPLYVVLGTPMRGVRGGELRQHLTVWHIDSLFAWGLKTALDKYEADESARARGERVERIVLDWAEAAKVSWCTVREDRLEIVTRRDHASPLGWFAGRTVAVWGCGALGGHMAEYLARAGVGKLVLRDSGVVTPGVLVRQPFDDADVGTAKAVALRNRLRRIRPDLDVEVSTRDILEVPLGGPDWVAGAEIVIDATASAPVMGLLEERRWRSGVTPVPIISMAIGHDAARGMVVLTRSEHSGGPLDASRRLKLEACGRPDLWPYLDEFWQTGRRPFFQPEPGCSDATFLGSAADVAGLAGVMLNLAAADLSTNPGRVTATGHFVAQPHAAGPGGCPPASFGWGPDLVCEDVHAGFQVRVLPQAWADTQAWIARSRVEAGPEVETGGLLFGERDEAAGVLWVSELSGPPPDSLASAEKFVCGVEGTAELNAEKRARTRGSVHYLGMWHTHPSSLPLPSPTDRAGMRRLIRAAGGAGRVLLLIVGCPHEFPMLGTYVFRAADLAARQGWAVRPSIIQVLGWAGSIRPARDELVRPHHPPEQS